jgi:hypothetical protein
LWNVVHRCLAGCYWHFGTAHWSCLQQIMNQHHPTSQKSEGFTTVASLYAVQMDLYGNENYFHHYTLCVFMSVIWSFLTFPYEVKQCSHGYSILMNCRVWITVHGEVLWHSLYSLFSFFPCTDWVIISVLFWPN